MRKNSLLTVLAAIAFLPCVVIAQIGGPSLGLVFDSASHALRPILGIPGAATLGDPLALEFELSKAAVSPAGYALAVRADNSSVMLIRAGGEASVLPDSETGPDAIAFNRTGSIAALYFSASKSVQIFEGLPDSAKLARAVDVTELPGPLGSLAVNADGTAVLAAASVGDDAAVAYLFPASGTAHSLGSFQTISALRFADDGADVLVADSQANSVYLVRSITGETTLIASERDGIAEPVDLAVDGRRILVVNKASGLITILDRDGAPPSSVECACKPTALLRLAGSSVFRLTEMTTAPLWMIDAGKIDTPVLAIPTGVAQ